MNRRKRALVSLTLFLACLAGFFVAAQVNFTSATFQEGQVVSASAFNDLLNANFEAAGTAIAALDADKQDRVAAACPEDSAIRAIGADGAVTCQAAGGFSLPFSGTADVPLGGAALAIEQTEIGGGTALEVTSANFGIEIASAYHVGLYMGVTGGTGLLINAAGQQNTYGGNGVQVNRAKNDGFVVGEAGGNALSVTTAARNGVLVGSAAENGVLVQSAGQYGVRIDSASDSGVYVGTVPGNGLFVNSSNVGVYVNTAAAYGGRFRGDRAGIVTMGGQNATPDLILAGNDATADDGRLRSDPNYRSSDLYLTSNDEVIVELDADGDEDGYFQVRNGTGQTVFQLAENGNATLLGTLTENSDAAAKTVHAPVSGSAVLESLVELPISLWSYLDDPDVTHIGPMAQDFSAAFGVGANDTSISTIDRDGVALAAIQGLNELVRAQQATIEALEERIVRLEARP